MRTGGALDALLPRTRQKILGTLLLHPDRWWYGAALARHLGLRRSSLQRELDSLTEAGILNRRVEGKQVYFKPNPECPFMPDLQSLLIKTAGLVDVLRGALEPHRKRIAVAFVYGSIARGEELPTSDVDLIVVGDVGLADIAKSIRHAQGRLAREVSTIVYSANELRDKARANHHLVRAVLDGEKLFVIGSRHELEETLGGRTNRAKKDHSRGTRQAPRARRATAR